MRPRRAAERARRVDRRSMIESACGRRARIASQESVASWILRVDLWMFGLPWQRSTMLLRAVKRAGGWKPYAAKHKRVLVGLVTKCKPIPDDAAGLVVEFYCPEGGY